MLSVLEAQHRLLKRIEIKTHMSRVSYCTLMNGAGPEDSHHREVSHVNPFDVLEQSTLELGNTISLLSAQMIASTGA